MERECVWRVSANICAYHSQGKYAKSNTECQICHLAFLSYKIVAGFEVLWHSHCGTKPNQMVKWWFQRIHANSYTSRSEHLALNPNSHKALCFWIHVVLDLTSSNHSRSHSNWATECKSVSSLTAQARLPRTIWNILRNMFIYRLTGDWTP